MTQIKKAGYYLMALVGLLMVFTLMPNKRVESIDVDLMERNVLIKKWQINKGIPFAKEKNFELYLKTYYPYGYEEDGATLDTSDTHTSSDSNIYIALKDGYEVVEFDQHGDSARSTFSGNHIFVKHSTKADNAKGTLVVKFTGFNVTYDLGEGGVFNENETSTITKKSSYGNADVPSFKVKPGYEFLGWEGSLDIDSSRTLKAKYSVTLKLDDKNYNVAQGSQVKQPEDPVKIGYNFGGWYYDTTFKNKVSFPLTVAAPMELHALWEASYLNVNYHLNGGTLQGTQTKSVQYDTLIGDLKTPVRLGYSFQGWFTQEDELVTDKTRMPAHDLDIFASWKQDIYTVSFDFDGGTSTPENQDRVYGQLVLNVEEPLKEGYVFLGWEYEGKPWNFETDGVTQNMRLVAKWQQIKYFNIDFETDGGTHVNSQNNIQENALLIKPMDPQKSGYTFKGWFVDDYNILWDFSKDVVTKDLVLHALWEAKSYEVSFDINQGWTRVPSKQIVKAGELIVKPHITPRRLGYDFISWTYEGNEWDFVKSIITNMGVTLKANYQIKEYSILFDSNGDHVQNMPKELINVGYQTEVNKPQDNPSRTDYKFLGWNTQPNGAGQSWDELFKRGMVLNDVKLYAQWEKNK